MDLMLLRAFQQQVLSQCEFMIWAGEDVNAALQNLRSPGPRRGTNYRVFYGVQNFLNAAANISKALWGQGGSLETERQALRDSIGISDPSPLREVTMRNNFEHFDERLDRWWKESTNHIYIDCNIGPPNMISGPIQDVDRFRHFDPSTTDLTFWGQQFNMQALMDEVTKFLPTLREEASKPHWDDS